MTSRFDGFHALCYFLCNFLSHVTSVPPLIQFHVDKKGRVNYAQTDMLIHVVNNQTNTILDVERCTFHVITLSWSGLSVLS